MKIDFNLVQKTLDWNSPLKNKVNKSWAELSSAKESRAEPSWAKLSRAEPRQAELSWAEPRQAELSWAEPNWAERNWAKLSQQAMPSRGFGKLKLEALGIESGNESHKSSLT